MKPLFAAAFAGLLAFAASAQAPEAPPSAPTPVTPVTIPDQPVVWFVGTFEGQTRIVEGAGAGTAADSRDSRVVITAEGSGFRVQWSTLMVDEENPSVVKVKDSTEILFAGTSDPTVFRGQPQNDLFTGRPIYWARIDGKTLFVNAVVVAADGTYDVTQYARTVEGDTMRVDFVRFKDGDEVRRVVGDLVRKSS